MGGITLEGKSGNVMEVDDDNRALVDAKSEWLFASDKGDAYTWSNESATVIAAATIVCVRNDNPDMNLHITKVNMHSDIVTEVEIHAVTDTFTAAGTAIVGENLNRTTQKTAQATAYGMETGNTQGDVVDRVYLKADTDYRLDYNGLLVLGNDQAIGVDYTASAAEAYVSISGYYK